MARPLIFTLQLLYEKEPFCTVAKCQLTQGRNWLETMAGQPLQPIQADPLVSLVTRCVVGGWSVSLALSLSMASCCNLVCRVLPSCYSWQRHEASPTTRQHQAPVSLPDSQARLLSSCCPMKGPALSDIPSSRLHFLLDDLSLSMDGPLTLQSVCLSWPCLGKHH